MAQYGKASYWDERYTKDVDTFDWYQVGALDTLASPRLVLLVDHYRAKYWPTHRVFSQHREFKLTRYDTVFGV